MHRSEPDESLGTPAAAVQQTIIDKKIKFYLIDAYEVARETEMGNRINTIMQTCFFAISGVLPREEAIEAIKNAIRETYGKRGEAVVAKNFAAVDAHSQSSAPGHGSRGGIERLRVLPPVPGRAPEFVRDVTGPMIAGRGDDLPVSAMPVDGTFPTGTAQWEKRNIAQEIPVWDEQLCIQCGKCVLVCPHAVIRAKVYDAHCWRRARRFQVRNAALARVRKVCVTRFRLLLKIAPAASSASKSARLKSKSEAKHKAINMQPQPPLRETESTNWDFFLKLPDPDRSQLSHRSGERRPVAGTALRIFRSLRGLR